MPAKPEFRKSERFSHEYIIKVGDDLTLPASYAVSCNLSKTGMYFKSLVELNPGVHILIRADNYTVIGNQIPARVVWCKKLGDADRFRYRVGVEFLPRNKNVSLKASLLINLQARTPTEEDGVWQQISEYPSTRKAAALT